MEEVEALLANLANPQNEYRDEWVAAQGFSEEGAQRIKAVQQAVLSHSQQTETAQQKLGKHLDQSAKDTFEVVGDLKDTLRSTLKSSRRLQTITTVMYISTFLLGIGLVIWAGIMGSSETGTAQNWLNLVYGGGGVVLIITNFIANPPQDLQRSRSNYAQLSVAMLAWFSDFMENSTVRQLVLQFEDLAPSERLDRLDALSEAMGKSTRAALQMMEDFAEPRAKQKA